MSYKVTRTRNSAERDSGRRASQSLTNNIPEGHGRFHYPDQIRFFLHSRGSLQELVDDVNICLDERYLPGPEVEKLKHQSLGVLSLINGYLRHLRSRSSNLHELDDADREVFEALDAIDL